MSTTVKIPLKLVFNSKASKVLLPATEEPAPLPKGQRPTKRAIALANALTLERKLMDGTFRSLADARRQLGFTRGIQNRVFRLLDLPPEEMAKILFETY